MKLYAFESSDRNGVRPVTVLSKNAFWQGKAQFGSADFKIINNEVVVSDVEGPNRSEYLLLKLPHENKYNYGCSYLLIHKKNNEVKSMFGCSLKIAMFVLKTHVLRELKTSTSTKER